MIKSFLLFVLSINIAISAIGQLKGTYTIDSAGKGARNYKTISLAAKALADSNISGPVIFNIADGTYNEQVKFQPISNSSAINTITFQAASGDSSKVSVDFKSSNPSNNYVFYFAFNGFYNGAGFYNFNHLTIKNSGSYSTCIFADTSANHISFYNSRIIASATSTALIGGGDELQYMLFQNSVLQNGSAIYAPESWEGDYNSFIGNTITGSIGGFRSTRDHFLIQGNTIKISSGNNLIWGHWGSIDLIGNKITNGTIEGDYLSIYMVNNFVISDDGEFARIQLGGIAAYYNSFLMNGNYDDFIYIDGDHGSMATVYFYNNIVVTKSSDYLFKLTCQQWPEQIKLGSDYNDLNGGSGAYLIDKSYSGLSGLKSYGVDSHSVAVNPNYFSTSNLHASSSLIHHKGKFNKYDPGTDIDGDLRDTISPDMGADEFKIHNVVPVSLISPLNGSCGDSQSVYTLKIYNKGVDTETNVKVYSSINGKKDSTVYKGTFYPNSYKTVSFPNTLDTRKGGIYSCVFEAYVPMDEDSTDTLKTILNIDSLPNAKFSFLGGKSNDIVFKANDSTSKFYSWNFGDTSKLDSGISIYHQYVKSGKYYVTLSVTNSGGCSSNFRDSVYALFVGIQNQTSDKGIFIYPNPASDKLFIEASLAQAPAYAYITDLSGKVLITQLIHSIQTGIDVSCLAKGMYILRYEGSVVKFVKE